MKHHWHKTHINRFNNGPPVFFYRCCRCGKHASAEGELLERPKGCGKYVAKGWGVNTPPSAGCEGEQ